MTAPIAAVLSEHERRRLAGFIWACCARLHAEGWEPPGIFLDVVDAADRFSCHMINGWYPDAGDPLSGFGEQDANIWSIAVVADYDAAMRGVAKVWADYMDVPVPGVVVTRASMRRHRGVETYLEAKERRAREEVEGAAKRREKAAKAVRYVDRDQEAARILKDDREAREAVGKALGGKIGSDFARQVMCPACSRPDVWFGLSNGWARCNHQNSCGWEGSVYDLALQSGVGT